tara:strand:+ start:359 stop:595 length:237 start_codon:yes stop_codon:yes gene_type:complete
MSDKAKEEITNSASLKRWAYMRKLKDEQKMEAGLVKAHRASIKAASGPLHTMPPLHQTVPPNFKLLIETNPELKSRFN